MRVCAAQEAVAALRDRPVLFKYCIEEVRVLFLLDNPWAHRTLGGFMGLT